MIVDEKRIIEDSYFKYEERLKAPTGRYLDVTPTPTEYFHIINNESTTEEGWKQVQERFGKKTGTVYSLTKDFPIYISDQIQLQLQNEEIGLDSSFSGEGTILPGTIVPVPGDYFRIPLLEDDYLFKVTEITYDNVMTDGFYRISFILEDISSEFTEELISGVEDSEKYVCILENIGTEENCIIKEEEFDKIDKIKDMYRRIVDFYISMFYNERHNSLLCPIENFRSLYDPLQTEFINKHNLLNDPRDIKTIMLTDQYDDSRRRIKYAKSLYHFIELRKIDLLRNFEFAKRSGMTIHESSFYAWHDKLIDVADPPELEQTGLPTTDIFSDEFCNVIRYNTDDEGISDYGKVIRDYIRMDNFNISNIPLTLDEELLYSNNSMEVFFFTPIILYIIRYAIKNTLKVYSKKDQIALRI